MDSDDGDGTRDEIAVVEARRIVDAQVATARAYEQRAAELLKIFLTIIGITTTVILVLLRFTPQETTFASFYTNSLHPETLSGRLEAALGFLAGFLSPAALSALATLFSTTALVGLVVVFYRTAMTWADVADYLREIYEPRELDVGVKPEWGAEDPVERYATIIAENQAEVQELKDAWGAYMSALFGGLSTFGVFVVLLATFSVPEPIATAYGTLIATVWVVDTVRTNREHVLRVREYVFLELPDAALAVLFAGLFYSGLQPDVPEASPLPGLLVLLTAASILAYPILLTRAGARSLRAVSLRNLLVFVAAFVAFVLYEVLTADGVNGTELYGFLDSLLLTAATCSLLAMVLSLFTQVVASVKRFATAVTE